MKNNDTKRSRCASKGILLNFLCTMLVAVGAALMAACENPSVTLDDDDIPTSGSGKKYTISVCTRSAAASDAMTYPITVYAMKPDGTITAQQEISQEGENISMRLPEGRFTLAAVSGERNFANGYSTKPLMTGKTTLDVEGSGVRANIVMGYAVAKLRITLDGMPETATSAKVSLGRVYGGITETGDYTGAVTATMPLTRESGGTWTTGTAFVLPTTSAETVMTISMTTPQEGQVSYGITYHEGLKAAVPYTFNGSFSGSANSGIEVTGTLSAGNWQDPVTGSFSFGPGSDNSFGSDTPGGGSSSGSGDVITVSRMPEAGSVIDGHIVVTIDNNGKALLLSATEWEDLTSAYYTSDPNVAKDIAAAYVESGLSGWTIPTAVEATMLMENWSGINLDILNANIVRAGLGEITLKNSSGTNARFLCEGATKTYTFAAGAKSAAAGATVKTYYLRLVKTVTYKLAQ